MQTLSVQEPVQARVPVPVQAQQVQELQEQVRVPERAPVQRVQVQPEREQQQVRAQQAQVLPELALQGQEQAQPVRVLLQQQALPLREQPAAREMRHQCRIRRKISD